MMWLILSCEVAIPSKAVLKFSKVLQLLERPIGHIAIIEICLVPSHAQKIVGLWTHRNNLKSVLYVRLSQKTSTKGLDMVDSILSSGIAITLLWSEEMLSFTKNLWG